ncbi:membrane-associated phospholipid phosphatase [Dyadobacter sp. BE34]|uniref:Membrane-associated phospholipid phosphatase n=1 Tax=Dyadobacter fermentans TaxID=94254 RepID=A0ABU1QV72_9BACT|nr:MULTISPECIES: phosphatase PAP2 family protein [Dyadobacter]MDR6805036.1 membrane-associated phospholipid phosphatase [Dyadobacter fermentans]MDR7043205.1 membrane-associated phospholipid phosphatase [Dyadobacter sp. BE242]MDR7197517.1 membrane-associated phospholipid phosphatase [Dyadobacter sp. BE34]MDR7215050.1 membrane-associated phospholipid phosphatase [Dyadobacter sp. BE31]MDR7262585.1 membrane-associated phospholipid phosphatase [Dyadobacter sp. BE32]
MRLLIIFLLISTSSFAQPFSPADSLSVRKPLTLQQFYAPASLIIGGLIANGHSEESIKNEVAESRNRHIPRFHTHIDNYMQFSPLVVAYGLDAFGIKSKTDVLNRTVILVKGEAMALTTATILKSATHTLRPDGSSYNSFPSGHTTQAFAAATFLNEEYKDRYPWMPYASYTVASSVGLLRVANNRHYISDVLVGAGIGYLSMKVAYWTHQYKWGKAHAKSQPVY